MYACIYAYVYTWFPFFTTIAQALLHTTVRKVCWKRLVVSLVDLHDICSVAQEFHQATIFHQAKTILPAWKFRRKTLITELVQTVRSTEDKNPNRNHFLQKFQGFWPTTGATHEARENTCSEKCVFYHIDWRNYRFKLAKRRHTCSAFCQMP